MMNEMAVRQVARMVAFSKEQASMKSRYLCQKEKNNSSRKLEGAICVITALCAPAKRLNGPANNVGDELNWLTNHCKHRGLCYRQKAALQNRHCIFFSWRQLVDSSVFAAGEIQS